MNNQSELIQKQQKQIAQLETDIKATKALYLKYSLMSRSLRIKNAKLKIQNSALKEREYTEDWVNANQETAATIFWNLWKMGAEVELDTDSRKEIFLGILAGADDITEELLDQLHSEYS